MYLDPYLTKIDVTSIADADAPAPQTQSPLEATIGKGYEKSLFTFVTLEKADFSVPPSQCKRHKLIFVKHKNYKENRDKIPLVFPNSVVCTCGRPFNVLTDKAVKALNLLFHECFLLIPLSLNKRGWALLPRGAGINMYMSVTQHISSKSIEVIDVAVAGVFREVQGSCLADVLKQLRNPWNDWCFDLRRDAATFEADKQVAIVDNLKENKYAY